MFVTTINITKFILRLVTFAVSSVLVSNFPSIWNKSNVHNLEVIPTIEQTNVEQINITLTVQAT